MALLQVPHKISKFGFAMQTAQGTAATTPTVVIPVKETSGITEKIERDFFQYADGVLGGPTHYFTKSQGLEGEIAMPLIPGMLVGSGGYGGFQVDKSTPTDTIADIGAWLFARETIAEADVGQGFYATLFVDRGHNALAYPDVKCVSGNMSLVPEELIMMNLTLRGIGIPTAWTPGETVGTLDWATTTAVTVAPYVFNHAAISLWAAADTHLKSLTLNWDNMVQSLSDAMTLGYKTRPQYLPNTELAQWTGEFDREFAGTTVYTPWANGTPGAVIIQIGNSVATAQIWFPRCIYSDWDVKIPTEGILMEDGISFQALGPELGGTAQAFIVSEVVATP